MRGRRKMKKSDCLMITDLQNDFCPGGALAVAEGDLLVEPVNQLMPLFPHVIASQDWHPKNHCSFKSQGGPWSPHCIQNTRGADFHPKLNKQGIHFRVHKAQFPDRDAYSAFQETDLKEELVKRKVKRIFLTGLATDYCVKHTALDALKHGFDVVVLTDLVRAIDAQPGDGEKALREIEKAGGVLTTSESLMQGQFQ
jgi:nicotinamidase/pyrazinamidase